MTLRENKRVFLICTRMESINLHFTKQVSLLSEMAVVYILCPLDDVEFRGDSYNDKNVEFIHLDVGRRPNLFRDIKNFLYLAFLIRQFKPDLLQSLMPKAGLIGMSAAKLMGVESRLHIFTGQVWANSRGLKRMMLKFADRIIAACASSILVDGISQAKFVVDNAIARSTKVSCIGYGSISGVDTLRYNFFKRQEFMKNRKNSDFTCLFLGRLNRDKGFHHILNVFEYLGEQRSRIKLLIAGEDEEGFLERISSLDTRFQNVEFMGHVEKPELLIERSNLLLLPSYREGFGSAVIEAGAMGVPCIGTTIYGLSDAIIHGVTGIRIEPGNEEDLNAAIVELMRDKSKYSMLSQNCRNFALERFDSEKVLGHWKELYSEHLLEKDD